MPVTNIISILTDDQGVWAAGCYGNPEIRTPNIDRLATTGTRFENFFAATPVCSPSRATLLTGRLPSQHGVHDWLLPAVCLGPGALNFLEDQPTYTEILARGGWHCGLSGKWHLGAHTLAQAGFQDWFVHPQGGGPYNDHPMIRGGVEVPTRGYITDVITDQALEWLSGYAAAGRTFHLAVHYTAPHDPWTGHPQTIVESYRDCPFASCPQEPRHPWAGALTRAHLGRRESLQGYFAAVTAMDAAVGRIVDRVEALGLRESTLIVFMSDNGFSCGHHGFWGKGNATTPRNMYENSIRVPAVFSQPGRVPAGRVEHGLHSAYDFAPTMLEYLGLAMPGAESLPGRSFLPALEGRAAPEREDVVVFDEYGPVRMIRTRQWKYVHRHPDGPHELYDLVNDPGERTDLAGEPGQGGRIRELRARMDAWFARYAIASRDGLGQSGTTHGQGNFLR
jgi:arylsulfatase A-like enzyme